MTLKMPSDPFGSPSGFFAFLDPLQEASPLDDIHPLPNASPSFDFIVDFEVDLDSSFEMLGGEAIENVHESEPKPVEVKSSVPLVRPVSTRAPSMPTILEEDEQEEEDGDITITPSEAQRALLPPDRFARLPSMSQLAGAVDAPQDLESDSLDTPRPRGGFRTVFWFELQLLILAIACTFPQPKRVPSPCLLQTDSTSASPLRPVSMTLKTPKILSVNSTSFPP